MSYVAKLFYKLSHSRPTSERLQNTCAADTNRVPADTQRRR